MTSSTATLFQAQMFASSTSAIFAVLGRIPGSGLTTSSRTDPRTTTIRSTQGFNLYGTSLTEVPVQCNRTAVLYLRAAGSSVVPKPAWPSRSSAASATQATLRFLLHNGSHEAAYNNWDSAVSGSTAALAGCSDSLPSLPKLTDLNPFAEKQQPLLCCASISMN